MRTGLRTALVLALALVVGGCATTGRLSAAGDIRAFLLSIRDDDKATFDAHVDRPALKAQLGQRLMAEAAKRGGTYEALAAVLGQTVVDVGVDQLVRPDVFRAVAESLGYSADRPIPGDFVIAEALRAVHDDHVCVVTRKDAPCTFVFANEGGVWRLTAFEGDLGQLRGHKRR